MPLEKVPGGGDCDHDAGACVGAHLSPHVLAECLRTALREIEQQLPPFAEYASQQPRHGEDDMAVRNGREHLFAQPFGPEEGALLLARGTERSAAARVWDQVGQAARSTPGACETALDEPACEEGPEHPLDHRTQRAVRLGEALLVHAQEFLEVLLNQTEERRVPSPPRPVDPTGDLHTSRPAGGRAPGENALRIRVRRAGGKSALEARQGRSLYAACHPANASSQWDERCLHAGVVQTCWRRTSAGRTSPPPHPTLETPSAQLPWARLGSTDAGPRHGIRVAQRQAADRPAVRRGGLACP